MIINPANLGAIYYNFNLGWQAAYDRTPQWWEQLATKVTSTTGSNRYAWTGLLPRMREWTGSRILKNLAGRVVELVNKDWEATIAVDRNSIEDDHLGIYLPEINAMGEAGASLANDAIAAALLAATTTTGYDGQAFFNASHPINTDISGGTTYSNLDASGKALTPANYADVRRRMIALNAEDGKPLNIRPNLLIVPPSLEMTAKQIVESDLVVNAFGINAATGGSRNVLMNTAQVLVIPELESQPTAWYLACTTKGIKPFIWQERKAPKFVALDKEDDENVFMRRKFIYGVDARGAAGVTLPFLISKAVA